MKLVRKSGLVGMRPVDGTEVFRYHQLDVKGINVVCAHQEPHTVREGLVANSHVCYIISGILTVTMDGQEVEVGPGDALSFMPRENRKMANNTDETAVLLLIDKGPGIPISTGPEAAPSGGPQ